VSITRVFRVQIHAGMREEFEKKFSTISVEVAKGGAGNAGVTILRPTDWAPDEYAMISEWRNEDALRQFAGESWNRAVIPDGMDQYIHSCSVHHYRSWT